MDNRSVGRAVEVSHFIFQVERYEALKEAYVTLLDHGVAIHHARDHVSQRSLYFADPDGNRLEICLEVADARCRSPAGREDRDDELPVSRLGEPLPDWLSLPWPGEI